MGNQRPITSHARTGAHSDARIAAVAIILLSLVCTVALLVASAPPAHASPSRPWPSCTGGNCRNGVIEYDWGTPYPTGGLTEMYQGRLTPTSRGSLYNFIGLYDYIDYCGNFQGEFAAGYYARRSDLQTWYFWDDCRPGVDSQPNMHWEYQVPDNNYGAWWYYEMYQYNSSQWEIDFFYDNWTWYWSGLSTSNSNMQDTIHVMGMRTDQTSSDTSGMGAITTNWRYNEYRNFQGYWYYVNYGGDHQTNSIPPSWVWLVTPTQYNNGGLASTCWC